MSEVFLRADIKRAEEALFERGVTERELIERAGRALTLSVGEAESVTIMVGGGNNGSDGVCAGLILADRGVSVLIFTVGEIKSVECKKLLEEASTLGIEIRNYQEGEIIYDEVVIDSIFGIGLNREPKDIYLSAIHAINQSGAKIVSADIPSGLDADNGKEYSECVKADVTVSFSGKKAGFFLADGLDVCGEIIYADCGIIPTSSSLSILEEVSFPKRLNNTHKGSYGKVSIIAGSAKYVGASLLAEMGARCAMRSGAGLVRLCVPNSMMQVYASRVLESSLFPIPDKDGEIIFEENVMREILSFSDVIAIGPGLGCSEEVKKVVKYVVDNFDNTVIIDADGLNSIACEPDLLKGAKKVVITPHLGEFARLTKKAIKDIEPIKDALDFANSYGVTVHLKGAGNVTALPCGKACLTCFGTPAMAKGGSGDVLTGIASAFFAQKIDSAMEKASFIHGISAREAEKKFGQYGTLARDIADCVALAIKARMN